MPYWKSSLRSFYLRRSALTAILVACLIACLAACASEPPTEARTPPASASVTLPPPQVTRINETPQPQVTPQTSTPIPQTPEPTLLKSTIDVATADLEGITLQFWHAWFWEAGDAIQILVDEFNITNEYGIRVAIKSFDSYSDLAQEMNLAKGTDELPNLVVGFTNQLRSWFEKDAIIVDLDPYVNDPIWGLTEAETDDFYATFWTQDLIGDQRIGIPAQRSGQFMFYNQTWAQELGFLEPPRTPEEFKEQACAAGAQNFNDESSENDSTGGWVVDTSTASVLSWIYAFGGDIVTEAGYQFQGLETGSALTYIKTLFDGGCAWLSVNRYPNNEFASRRALFISSSSTGFPFQETAFQETGNTDQWIGIAYPAVDGQPVVDVFGPSFSLVESTAEEQLATWLVLKWLHSPKNQARWAQASGSYPSRQSALENLELYMLNHPQWAASLELLSFSRNEPRHASWGVVRWALSDAAEEVFRIGLTEEQIPLLLEKLDLTASELHAQRR